MGLKRTRRPLACQRLQPSRQPLLCLIMYNYISIALKECHFALKQSGTSCGAQGSSDGTVVSRLFDKQPQPRHWKAAIAAIRDFKEAVTIAVICMQPATCSCEKVNRQHIGTLHTP